MKTGDKASQGYHPGSHDNAFHINKFPPDVWQNKLIVPTVAVDSNQIGLGTHLTIPSLAYPWGDVVFEATDIGTAILDRYIDVFVGEGHEAEPEIFLLTGNDGRVCFVNKHD